MKMIAIAAAILVLSMVTVFAAPNSLFELIKKISPEKRITDIVDKGFGNRLNISSVDKDIRVTITDVVADDIQTLILYKVEDLKSGKEYYANFIDGIEIKERWGIGSDTNIDMYTSTFNYQGKGSLTLYPIDTEEKTIHLTFKKLDVNPKDLKETVEGNWSFEVPIKKYHGKTYAINKSLKVGDYTIKFNKITISPTLTVLSYDCMGYVTDKKVGSSGELTVIEKIEGLEDLTIISKGKEYGTYNFGHGQWGVGYGSNEMTFESMFFDDPRSIEIKVNRIVTAVRSDEVFIVDLSSAKPQEFEYLGTKITVDNIKVDKDITLNVRESLGNRKYGVLRYSLTPVDGVKAERYLSSGGNHVEVYYIDKDGNQYEYYEALSKWKEIRGKKPVYNVANTAWTLRLSEKLDVENLKKLKMVIEGYTKTGFVNEKVKVRLE